MFVHGRKALKSFQNPEKQTALRAAGRIYLKQLPHTRQKREREREREREQSALGGGFPSR